MKERTDKRDYLTLAASFLGIKVDWRDGVYPDSVSEKSYPLVRMLHFSQGSCTNS